MHQRWWKLGGGGILILSFFLLISLEFKPSGPFNEFLRSNKRSSERGIYVTYWVAKTPKRFNYLRAQAKQAGLNTIVLDVKELLSSPLVELAKEHQLNNQTKATPDPWLARLTNELHRDGFIVTARLVTFKDDHLVIARPDLGVQLPGGALYRDRKGGKWADPYAAEVRLYNALVAERAALSGVDEVQFDYIRFPAEGGAHKAIYPALKPEISKVEIICTFLAAVRERLKPYQTSMAVDIFGVTAWQSKIDIQSLGQDLKRMGKYLDVLSPMLYPSHFHNGYDGYANPGAEPYYFLRTGVKQAKEILSSEAVVLVPWLQAFNMKSPNYGPDYIRQQVKACQDEGVERYLLWNANNNYDIPFNALRGRQ